MDLDWCLTCSQHTEGTLYCSDACRSQDITYSNKITSSPSYSFYSKSFSHNSLPPPLNYNYRSTKRTMASSSITPPPTPSPTSAISTALFDHSGSKDSSYQSSNDENVIAAAQYTKTLPWVNQRQQQSTVQRLFVLT
ncbi:9037_t:CDS:2 [Funneliformis geosporum]|uniref:1839_t:CDS:1 n=1 Tax=Funneliformis geosporum TaxID=1117311 RepID=A0A9W4SN89_9GLOM|nr:1839_t:CDS:2 [Funneliformis geosporum]CAI2176547.1 9037_t:CDS:2 [Funneliformis geosporum]